MYAYLFFSEITLLDQRKRPLIVEKRQMPRHTFTRVGKSFVIEHLLLATGRAISNLERNWKYCSSVCSVKPVPTSSICTKKTEKHQRNNFNKHKE